MRFGAVCCAYPDGEVFAFAGQCILVRLNALMAAEIKSHLLCQLSYAPGVGIDVKRKEEL